MIASPPLASLGMYDLPWLRAETDALWAALRDRLRAAGLSGVPEALERDRPLHDIWTDPALLFAQTCGYPLVTTLAGRMRVVATPCYDLSGCDGPSYCSFLVVSADNPALGIADLRGGRAAINGWDSQSGMSALRAMVAPLAGGASFFCQVSVSGAHVRSIEAVRSGAADLAAIDCVTWGLVAERHPERLIGLRILGRTPAAPGLPYVTAAETPDSVAALLADALDAVLADPALAPVRAALHLSGAERMTAADYAPILALRDAAAAQNYPALA